MGKDYYAVLDVDRQATRQAIRARFLDLAREKHPDLVPADKKLEAEEIFQGITEAFNILFNAEKRRLHDIELSTAQTTNQAADPQQLMKVYMSRGSKAYKEKNYSAAAENFDRATQHDPKNAQAWYNLALTCVQNPRWRSKGLKAISEACNLDKMNSSYHKTAGKMFAQAGMSIRSERYLKAALQWGGPDEEIEQLLSDLKKGK